MLWNHVITPAVSEAVIKGAGSDSTTPGGQQKVANTALYVLMQRAVVSGCPLSGQGKSPLYFIHLPVESVFVIYIIIYFIYSRS